MKAAFLISSHRETLNSVSSLREQGRDATAWHSALPRPMRKTIRLPTPKTSYNVAQTDLTETFRRDAYCVDNYYLLNHEFMEDDAFLTAGEDIDDEFEGLTIVECSGDAELFHFCTGYEVL